jgi:citronellol/citronellal dehydrogenase
MAGMTLSGRTLFITGASRGIGLAIAKRAARDGANIAIAAKSDKPHPKLPGTIYTAAAEIEAAGGQALPLVVDVRSDAAVTAAVQATVNAFGGIDVCVNNASAIGLTGTLDTEMKRFDLMHQINVRGTFLTSQACLPFLLRSENPHILTLSPPLNLRPDWFGAHVAYTTSKYGMSALMLGMAEEFRVAGVACNCLWPITAIATSAIRHMQREEVLEGSRSPEIMADAAHAILSKPAREFTGQFVLDEFVLRDHGVNDFSRYQVTPGGLLMPDLFVSEEELDRSGSRFGRRLSRAASDAEGQ